MKTFQIDAAHRAETIRRKGLSRTRGGLFAEFLDQGAAISAGFEASAVVSVGSILTVQETIGSSDDRPRALARAYGDHILDQLDSLKLDIVSGGIPSDRLVGLAQSLRAKRNISGDPGLDAIIEEIELRAEVELAKLTRGR